MGGSLVYAAKTAKYTYESLINKILDVAVMRYFGASNPVQEKEPDMSKPLRVIARTYLRGHLQSLKENLRDFVNLNTHVYNIDNVNKLGNIISRRLQHLGFNEHIHKQFDVGDFRFFTNHDEPENDVLIVSHIDTHYGPNDLINYYESGDKILGSGIAESKGGIVVMLGVLHALRFAKKLRKVKCAILLTTDDGLGGRFSKELVEQYSKKIQIYCWSQVCQQGRRNHYYLLWQKRLSDSLYNTADLICRPSWNYSGTWKKNFYNRKDIQRRKRLQVTNHLNCRSRFSWPHAKLCDFIFGIQLQNTSARTIT